MLSPGLFLLSLIFFPFGHFFPGNSDQLNGTTDTRISLNDTSITGPACVQTSSSLLLNSVEEKDEWTIISGPVLKGISYPVQALYTKPFPSWEMDRYTADSSYFKDCAWMVLPDKRKVVNTVSRLPIVFTRKFTTNAASRFNLVVKMLYDNMAYLYIDSFRISLNHRNADINRFIKEIRPELSSFVSIPATFNYSYNASFYAAPVQQLFLEPGEHTVRIELFNNANELGCIIKGMLMSANGDHVFCAEPLKDDQSELASILVFNDKQAFTGSKLADTLYYNLMQSVKSAGWFDNRLKNDQDILSQDTLFLKKGEKINISPGFITEFYNGSRDTVYTSGSFKKISAAKNVRKEWQKTFVFDALVAGTFLLEINCTTPATACRISPNRVNNYRRVIKVK